jgi:hypothetical protein
LAFIERFANWESRSLLLLRRWLEGFICCGCAAAAAADTRLVAFQSPSPELHAPLKTHLKKLTKNMKKNIYIKA